MKRIEKQEKMYENEIRSRAICTLCVTVLEYNRIHSLINNRNTTPKELFTKNTNTLKNTERELCGSLIKSSQRVREVFRSLTIAASGPTYPNR